MFFERYEKVLAFIKWPIHKIGLAAGLLLIYALPLVAPSEYLVRIVIWIAAWALAAAGLNLLFGLAGQISLAQGAFMALGAFTSIYLAKLGIPPLLAMPLAGVLVSLAGLVFGLPSLRLKELYLLITTLGAQFFFDWLLRTEKMAWFSGGAYAVYAPPLSLGPLDLSSGYPLYAAVITITILHLAALANLGRSYIGRAFKAIRDRDVAAEIIGVNVFKYKLLAFVASAYLAAVGGALWAFAVRSVSVESFTFLTSLEVFAAVLIGGLGRVVWGSVLGAAFVVGVPEAIKIVLAGVGIRGLEIALRDVIFGAIILAFLLTEPLGIVELMKKVKERLRLFPFRYFS
ncbi:MAG: branched-chain amino acid ABC transporter permease [Pyrobaculum sp.]